MSNSPLIKLYNDIETSELYIYIKLNRKNRTIMRNELKLSLSDSVYF